MIELFKNRKLEFHQIAEEYYQRLITLTGTQEKVFTHYLQEEIDKNNVNQGFLLVVQSSLRDIILAQPEELKLIIYFVETKLNNLDKKKLQDLFISYYKDQNRWGAYELAKKLKVNVCPYCNVSYTFTVGEDTNKGARPQYDHFFDKATYPYLALSFYNLIPSCGICNSSFKGQKKFKLNRNVHPYFEGFNQSARFTSRVKTYEALIGQDEANLIIGLEIEKFDIEKNRKISGNTNAFKLNELYSNHTSIVSELYMKKQMSNDKYLEMLQKTYANLNLSKSELYRLAFGNFMEEENFHLRPLSKLTHDIAKELGLLD